MMYFALVGLGTIVGAVITMGIVLYFLERGEEMPKSLRVILKKKHLEGKLTDQDYKEILDKLDGHDRELAKGLSNFDRTFNFVNDLRFAISPDELTPAEQRPKKIAQVEVLDRVLDYMLEITR